MPLDNPLVTKQSVNQLTLSDLAARLDPKGNVADFAEILQETNEILQDIPYIEGNLPTGHRVSIRTGLPEAYWKMMNRGVPSSKSEVAMTEETCGRIQARSIIDKDELELNGNKAAYRKSEDVAFIEALNQKMTRALFYNNSRKNHAGFMGLAPRYDHLVPDADRYNPDCTDCCKNVIDCGGTDSGAGTGTLTSIWIISWGVQSVFGIYPKGTKVGLSVTDRGLIRVLDDDGNPYDAYETVYDWSNGLVVKDWRHVVRLANIDVRKGMNGEGIGAGDITQPNSTNLILKLQDGLGRIPHNSQTKVCIYMNSDTHALLNRICTRAGANVIEFNKNLTTYGGTKAWSTFMGYPIRRVDALQNNEDALKELSTMSTYNAPVSRAKKS